MNNICCINPRRKYRWSTVNRRSLNSVKHRLSACIPHPALLFATKLDNWNKFDVNKKLFEPYICAAIRYHFYWNGSAMSENRILLPWSVSVSPEDQSSARNSRFYLRKRRSKQPFLTLNILHSCFWEIDRLFIHFNNINFNIRYYNMVVTWKIHMI